MHFTTTTELARQGSKIFSTYDEAIVLNNNKNIGLVLGWELAQAVLDSWVINQIREELWEVNDKETSESIKNYKDWGESDMISLTDYRKKYGL